MPLEPHIRYILLVGLAGSVRNNNATALLYGSMRCVAHLRIISLHVRLPKNAHSYEVRRVCLPLVISISFHPTGHNANSGRLKQFSQDQNWKIRSFLGNSRTYLTLPAEKERRGTKSQRHTKIYHSHQVKCANHHHSISIPREQAKRHRNGKSGHIHVPRSYHNACFFDRFCTPKCISHIGY